MSLADVFNELGQSIMPQVLAATSQGTLTIKQKAETQGSDGGIVYASATNFKTSVPCRVISRGGRSRQVGDKTVSIREYNVIIPTHLSGTRIDLDADKHYFVTDVRGNEPARTLRIVNVDNKEGIRFECICEEE